MHTCDAILSLVIRAYKFKVSSSTDFSFCTYIFPSLCIARGCLFQEIKFFYILLNVTLFIRSQSFISLPIVSALASELNQNKEKEKLAISLLRPFLCIPFFNQRSHVHIQFGRSPIHDKLKVIIKISSTKPEPSLYAQYYRTVCL